MQHFYLSFNSLLFHIHHQHLRSIINDSGQENNIQ